MRRASDFTPVKTLGTQACPAPDAGGRVLPGRLEAGANGRGVSLGRGLKT